MTFLLRLLDISNEINVFAYNLSDEIFMETIIYLQNFGLDYFEFIRNNLDKFDEVLLEVRREKLPSSGDRNLINFCFQRMLKQLDPFDPIYRPILFKVKNQNIIKEMENVSKLVICLFHKLCANFTISAFRSSLTFVRL